MAKIKFEGAEFECRSPESLLGAAIEAGIEIPYGCQSGSCHLCSLTDVKTGEPILACCTIPQEDMEVRR